MFAALAIGMAATMCLIFESNAHSPRIIGGRKAELGEFPMMAHIMYYPSEYVACGGSVITNIIVMSAAHCFKRCDDLIHCTTKYRIVVGDVSRLKNENSPESRQLKYLKTLIPHEEYNPDDFRNDIILIELPTPIVFSENVAAAVLARTRPVPHEICIAAGWGRTYYDVWEKPATLLAVSLQISEEKRCIDWSTSYWREGMICVGDSVGGNDVCFGDSGGPLICNGNVVVGIACYVQKCRGYISGYTDVSAYQSWILGKIQAVNLRNGCMRSSVTFFTVNIVCTFVILKVLKP